MRDRDLSDGGAWRGVVVGSSPERPGSKSEGERAALNTRAAQDVTRSSAEGSCIEPRGVVATAQSSKEGTANPMEKHDKPGIQALPRRPLGGR